MSTRKWVLFGSIVLTLTTIVVLIVGLNKLASPAVDLTNTLPTQASSASIMTRPILDHPPATPSATSHITATPSPSTTPTFLPPDPTQLTVELSSTPSEIPPVTAAFVTVTGSQLSEPFDLPAGLYRITLQTVGG